MEIIRDKQTGARFYKRNRSEQREKDSIHHTLHYEQLIKAIFTALTPEQKTQVRDLLASCPHKCVRRVIDP